MAFYGDVCAGCVDDPDLQRLIRDSDGDPVCDYCGRDDEPTMYVGDLADFIGERLPQFYGKAEEQIPWDSEEGDYIDSDHYSTRELLFEQIGLDLPRDSDERLADALVDAIGEDEWSAFDWASSEPDQILLANWSSFCRIIKHRRRFFFHEVGARDSVDREISPPLTFLQEISRMVEEIGLIQTMPAGYEVYRARCRTRGHYHTTAKALGPPPRAYAFVANRMSPPGIPMFYGSEEDYVAAAEIDAKRSSIGRFVTERPIRILDLATLPEIPGLFSDQSRDRHMALSFLHQFSELISQPIERDERVHIDYIPTQAFTEYLRDHRFSDGRIRGIRYPSARDRGGVNVVLFATQRSVSDAASPPDTQSDRAARPWLRLAAVEQIRYSRTWAGERARDLRNRRALEGLPLFTGG